MPVSKGAVVIDTRLNYQKIKKEFKGLEKDTSKLIDKYNKSVDSIKSQELAISKVKTKLDALMSGEKTPSNIKSLEKGLKDAEKEVTELEKQYQQVINDISQKQIDLEFAQGLGKTDEVVSIKVEQGNLDTKSLELATQLENAKDKAEQLKAALSEAKLNPENSSEVYQLSQQLDVLNSKLSQTKEEANQTKNEINEAFQRRHLLKFGDGFNEIGKKFDKFKSKMTKLIGAAMIFNLLRNSLTNLRNKYITLLKSNDDFSSSLNQIKANLMTAFAPIYNACLPAINSLMNALSKITGTIAVFVSGLFGTSLENAKNQAKGLSKALDETKKSGEEASGSLASFDNLEVISNNSSNTSGSGNSGIDYSGEIQASSKLLDFLNKIKESLSGIDFSNLNNSLGNLKEKLSSFGDIVGGALWWVWENILVPLAQCTIENVLPAFLDILSGALSVLNQACIDLQPIWKWFWKNFLRPIAEWTGGVIVDVLEGIGDALQWISQNEIAMSILEGIAIAIGLVAAAIGVYNGVMAICNIVTGIFSGIMTTLTSPITLVALAIGALIAIILLCIKHWDDIKKVAVAVWEKIKEVWNTVASWFNDTVIQPVVEFFSGMWNGLVDGAAAAWNGIKDVFSTVASFFKNIFSNAWNAVKKVFSVGGKIFDGIKDGIIDGFKAIVNAIIGGINKVVAIPFNGINGALRKIRDISFLGISPFKGLIKEISVPQIPQLATGAVIPPRQKFLAMLGDQKHGTNIEAPLETIKQANREVMQEFIGAFSNLNNDEKEIVFRNLTIVAQFGNKDFSKIVVEAVRMAEKEMGKQLFVSA